MLFSTTNLITPAAAVKSVRQLLETIAGPSNPRMPERDRLLQAITLACTDLDQADPIILPTTIDTSALLGQDSPSISVGNRYIGYILDGLYMPAAIKSENQIPYSQVSAGTIIPDAVISDDLMACIRWPRAAAPAVIVPFDGRLFACSNIASTNVALTGATAGPTCDGVTPDTGALILCIAQTLPAQNGLYDFSTDGFSYTMMRPSVITYPWAHHGSVFSIANGTIYAGSNLQLTTSDPITIGTTATAYALGTTYDSNIDTTEFSQYICPRAVAYLAQALAMQTSDKNAIASLTAWALATLARPLPVHGLATLRVMTASRYAST